MFFTYVWFARTAHCERENETKWLSARPAGANPTSHFVRHGTLHRAPRACRGRAVSTGRRFEENTVQGAWMKYRDPIGIRRPRAFRGAMKTVFFGIVLALTGNMLASKPAPHVPKGIVSDWTQRHVLYPDTQDESAMARFRGDPRWEQNWYLRHRESVVAGIPSRGRPVGGRQRKRLAARASSQAPRAGRRRAIETGASPWARPRFSQPSTSASPFLPRRHSVL